MFESAAKESQRSGLSSLASTRLMKNECLSSSPRRALVVSSLGASIFNIGHQKLSSAGTWM
jgi:hypothetical protein